MAHSSHVPPARPAGFAIERRAFAKINLDLRILGTRPDGYHELATVFQTISMHDRIRIDAAPPDRRVTLRCSDPAVPADDRNLAWRAAARLWQAFGGGGDPRGLSIAIDKVIPTLGGLGGGSANAAVVLAALNEWWGGLPDRRRLTTLASGLGADVPFFLLGGTAHGTGRGDALDAWPDLPRLEVVLLRPAFGVSTADAYRWYDESGAPPSTPLDPPAGGAWRDWLASCRNDLEGPVGVRHPSLRDLVRRLSVDGALLALLSGSGSTVFGLFEDARTADASAAAWPGADLRVERAHTVTRAEYVTWALGGMESNGRLPPASAIV